MRWVFRHIVRLTVAFAPVFAMAFGAQAIATEVRDQEDKDHKVPVTKSVGSGTQYRSKESSEISDHSEDLISGQRSLLKYYRSVYTTAPGRVWLRRGIGTRDVQRSITRTRKNLNRSMKSITSSVRSMNTSINRIRTYRRRF